jgi:hypothetical protein
MNSFFVLSLFWLNPHSTMYILHRKMQFPLNLFEPILIGIYVYNVGAFLNEFKNIK